MEEETYAQQLVARFLEVIAPLSTRQAAERTGISHIQISRFRKGLHGKRLQKPTREQMEAYLREHAGESLIVESPEDSALMAHCEGVLRRVTRSWNAEKAKFRKLDALDGLWRFYLATGDVPNWWFRLRQKVEAGEV